MKWPTIHHVLVAAVLVSLCAVGLSQAGELRAWGLDGDGQVTGVPSGGDYIAVAAGDAHGLALRSDGIVVAWGRDGDGQCDVPVGTYRAIGAGADFSLAIRSDGSIAAWGYDGGRQVSDVPQGNDFVAVDGGEFFAVALKSDGSIVAWGNDRWGQVSDVPSGADFTAVVAGDDHAVALRSDGSLVAWGTGRRSKGHRRPARSLPLPPVGPSAWLSGTMAPSSGGVKIPTVMTLLSFRGARTSSRSRPGISTPWP
ncbi:MAG: hypothetical protein ABFD90_05905 [Phycisphaerales bacterium]